MFSFAHVKDSGIREFYLGNLESWALESGIQLKESGILLMIGIRNPVPGIWNVRRWIQILTLSWIPLRGVIQLV